jgi:hypothetical protein
MSGGGGFSGDLKSGRFEGLKRRVQSIRMRAAATLQAQR